MGDADRLARIARGEPPTYDDQVAIWEANQLVKHPTWNPYHLVRPEWAYRNDLHEIFSRNLPGYPMWLRADSDLEGEKMAFIDEMMARKEAIEWRIAR